MLKWIFVKKYQKLYKKEAEPKGVMFLAEKSQFSLIILRKIASQETNNEPQQIFHGLLGCSILKFN